MDTNRILAIIRNGKSSKGGVISILEEIQAECTYLPESALRLVAEETGRSLADIYGVATFYKAFSLKPRGRHCLSACLGTACHVRGAQKIVEELKQQLNISPGETTSDKEITFETVNCLGACALGPIVVSDEQYFANVTARKVKDIIRDTKEGSCGSDRESGGHLFPIEVFCPRCHCSLMDNGIYLDGYPSILINISMEGKTGLVRMTSLYGRFTRVHEHEMPENRIANYLCPHCGSALQDISSCMECGAPMASMKLKGGYGVFSICTCTGCKGHLLDLDRTDL